MNIMGTNRRYGPGEKVHDFTYEIAVWTKEQNLVEVLLKTRLQPMAEAAFALAPQLRPDAHLITLTEWARVMRSHPPEVAQPWLAKKPAAPPSSGAS